MSDPNSVVQVRRDGQVLETFQYDTEELAENEAFKWILKHQPMSVDWAIKYEGYSIVIVHADGNEETIKY